MKLLDIINEQSITQSLINRVYSQIVSAVVDFGTDKPKLISAIKEIETLDEFKTLLSLFKDRKTGYGSFEEMINGEFDQFDLEDFFRITKHISTFGVRSFYTYFKTITGGQLFNGGFRMVFPSPPEKTSQNAACQAKWGPLLVEAVKYWRSWLTNPITKQKFKINWEVNPKDNKVSGVNVDLIFQRYVSSLDKLRIIYYDKETNPNFPKDAYAFVYPQTRELIYINCSLNDPEPLDTLVHEIQHILYAIHPLNPERKIGSVFVKPGTKKDTPLSFLSSEKQEAIKQMGDLEKKYGINFDEISKRTGIESAALRSLYEWAKAQEERKGGYICRETEKMSNIMAIRKLFGLNPGDNITYQMLKPYISGKKLHTDIKWLLGCWAITGFTDINETLNKINQLALQQTGSADDQQYA